MVEVEEVGGEEMEEASNFVDRSSLLSAGFFFFFFFFSAVCWGLLGQKN